jgi:Mo-dependent nitrogenase C-terminus
LSWLRQWPTDFEITDGATAHLICRLISAQCLFGREIALFGRTLVRIPPLCKLNPLYAEVVGLRLRALCYLADCGGEDVGQYC